jgi:hypothetical protein
MKLSPSTSVAFITLALSLHGGMALASGSESITGGQTSDTALYNTGKGVYADKFACSSCPLASKSLSPSIAKDILSGTPKVQLSSDEQSALSVYLKRRFKI